MKITYINNNDDMLVKYTYQQINNPKVDKKMSNYKNLYLFGGVFLLVWDVILYYTQYLKNPTGSKINEKTLLITLILAIVMFIYAFSLKSLKKISIKNNVKKGIKASTDYTFKPVTLTIDGNRFEWDSNNSYGHTYITPENKSIILVEDDDYFFISGKNNLDLVIPKKRITNDEIEEIKKCFSYLLKRD